MNNLILILRFLWLILRLISDAIMCIFWTIFLVWLFMRPEKVEWLIRFIWDWAWSK